MTKQIDSVAAASILLVDDEPNIVHSIHRALRARPYRLLSASSGNEAIAVMERCTVDVLISDSRMPGMDGPSLLSEVRKRWPATIRILLTGYADIADAARSINDGNVFRYINKPWTETDLIDAIEHALHIRMLELDRERLRSLTERQNRELLGLNASLEALVVQRTRALAESARRLETAHNRLREGYVTATEVFASMLNQRLPKNRRPNDKVIALVKGYGQKQNMEAEFCNDLAMAGALYNLGKLGWGDDLLMLPREKLDKERKVRYSQYPALSEALLMSLDPAQKAALYIRHHQERWDGKGYPDGVAGENIPVGARILRLAVDFSEMHMGIVLTRELSTEEVVGIMSKYAGRLYDPELCLAFLDYAADFEREANEAILEENVKVIGTHELSEGMVLQRQLHGTNGVLLLKSGTVLTEKLIDRLVNFERNEGSKYAIHVAQPAPSVNA